MASTLVRGRHVVVRVTGRDEAQVIEDGAVFQRDGRIVAVGPYADLLLRYEPDETLGSPDDVVIPGLVNAHHHVGITPVQHGSRDHALELWFASLLAARGHDLYLDTLYSAFEMIESGVTTVQHLHGWATGGPAAVCASLEKAIAAYRDVGMRCSFSYGVGDQNLFVYGNDDAFCASLPPETGRALAAHLAAFRSPLEEQGEVFEELHRRHGKAPRTRIQLAPNNLHWCSDRALAMLRELSERHAAPMHMHLDETPYQKAYARARAGCSAIAHLERHGLLTPAMTLGHGVWFTQADIEKVAAAGARICHNASSNLRLRSGIAPLNAFHRCGVECAIGMDEAGINDDRDMLQEMRVVLNVHRVPGMDDTEVPTAAQVLRMATEHGARTTPFAAEIGTLEPGKAADLVLLDWRQIAHPHLALDHEITVVDAIVHRAKSKGVRTVMVAGEVVYRDGRFTKVDRDAAVAELAAELAGPRTAAEQARLRLSREVMPHVRAFYARHLDGEVREPFYRQNARA